MHSNNTYTCFDNIRAHVYIIASDLNGHSYICVGDILLPVKSKTMQTRKRNYKITRAEQFGISLKQLFSNRLHTCTI